MFLIFLLECGFHMFAHLLQTLTRLSQGLHSRYLPYIAEQTDQANRMQVNSLCSSTQLATGSDFGRSRPVVWILRLTTFSDGCGMLYPTKLTWGLQTIIYIFSSGRNQYSGSKRWVHQWHPRLSQMHALFVEQKPQGICQSVILIFQGECHSRICPSRDCC